MKTYLSKSQSRSWAAFDTIGDAFGGPAFGEFNDPVTAIVGSAVIGGALQSNSSRSAASAQADASAVATAETRRQYDQNRTDMQPFRDAGIGALNQQTAGLRPGGDFSKDFTLADFNADPGYAYRVGQGTQAVEGSAAARGGLLSGGTLSALTKLGQDYGSQEYQNAYTRFNSDRDRRFNRLSAVAGTGQTATTNTAQMGTDAVSSMNNTNLQGANATASGIMGGTNAIMGGVNSGINGYTSMSMLNRFAPSAGGAGAVGAGTTMSGNFIPTA